MAFELKLYDTLTRDKRPFVPIDPANVRMYVCGPTVYDFAHIGNARPVIVFDVLFRLLRHVYGPDHVTYVRNITDVDDKINARAAERGVDIRQLTNETYENFKADVAALGCLPPTVEPRATEHIAEMRDIIERLIKSGHAYVAEDHVLFDVPSMPDYGKLSNRPLDDMIAGARVEVAPYKRNPTDFVLWKPSKPGEPSWPSPAGIATSGRPGWHIECSAMAWKHLGETFDIHGGGIDLVFPHHENEIAQSRCAFDSGVMANYWMHNGFLQVEGEKMSKSLGNFVTIRELLENWKGTGWPGEALRFNMLRTHYRQPIDWTEGSLNDAHKTLWDWYGDLEGLQSGVSVSEDALDCLRDDLNTPMLLAELHALRRRKDFQTLRDTLHLLGFSGKRENIARVVHAVGIASRRATVEGVGSVGATSQLPPLPDTSTWEVAARVAIESHRQRANTSVLISGIYQNPPLTMIDEKMIQELVDKRTEARRAKNFAESDRIRDELAAMGVVLKDSKEGTTWEIAR
jgi:cysteinyl-tRNA synthetase